ncbi:MAG: hypothetical protein ACRD2M_09655 [Terriglobales bacterium]
MNKFAKIGLMTAVVVAMTSLASAQINSGAQPITLNAQLAESLTMSLSAANVNFTLTPGSATNAGSTSITSTTSWVLKPGRTQVNMYAYFGSAASALVHQDPANTVDIPSSAVEISVNGGANQALSTSEANAVGFGAASAGKRLLNVPITGLNKVVTGRNDTLAFNINLSSLAQLPADDYVGTVNIQVQAIN